MSARPPHPTVDRSGSPPPWLRHTLHIAGHRISALERPSPSAGHKSTIVLLHGLVAEANTFRRLMSLLPSDRRVIALDMPGAGYSNRPTSDDVSFAGIAQVVLEAFRALDLDRPILLGHSHGGAISLALVAHDPAAVGALILLCPAHPFSAHENNLVRFYLSRPGHLFARTLPHVPRWLFLAAFRNMPGQRVAFGYPELEPYVHTLRAPGTVGHILRMLKTWFDDMAALRTNLQASRPPVPTLALWGARDLIVPSSTAPDLLYNLPNSTFVLFPHLGHVPNDENPAETAKPINRWLEDQP